MTHYCIYASDYSGSTNGDSFYNDNAMKTLEYFDEDVKRITEEEENTDVKTVYLQWGADCIQVDKETVRETYRKRNGNSGDTRPQEIIEWIKKHIPQNDYKIKLLYIITDGVIYSNAEKCLELNADIMYEKVVFYAYNKTLNYINLSVAASFFKKECTVIRNNKVMNQVNIERYDYDSVNIENFATKIDSLVSYIQLKFLTVPKSDHTSLLEIEKLKKLRNRLFDEQKSKESTESKQRISFDGIKDKDAFIETFKHTDYYQILQDSSMYNVRIEIEKCFATLINYVNNDKKSYEFDALKYDTKYKSAVEEDVTEPLDEVNWPDEEKIDFPDIISFDESKNIPVILLATLNLPNKIIFHSNNTNQAASFSKFKSICDCPLFLLNDKDFNDNSVCYFYTVDVYEQLLKSETFNDPYSRRSFTGGIILSKEFDRYNDYIIAASYFDFKTIRYNKGLVYYVLWKICDRKEWMNRNVVEKFKEYVLRRVAETTCYIGLSSLPLDPLINTSLPSALWYCVELSSHIFKDDDDHYSKERLQFFNGVAQHMIDILTCLDYPLNVKFIQARVEVLKYVTILKRIPTMREKKYYMASKIFKVIDGFLINEIAHQENIQKLNYIKLNHKNKVNESVLKDKINLKEYVYFLDFYDVNKIHEICENTLRPHFVLVDSANDQMKSYYSEIIKQIKRVSVVEQPEASNCKKFEINYEPIKKIDFQRITSLYKLYNDYVIHNENYPTMLQYQEYVLNKKKYGPNDSPAIFGPKILQHIKDVFTLYEEVVKNVPAADFIAKSKKCVNRLRRIKEEPRHPFKTEEEISEFIRKEECKCVKSC